MGSVPQQIRITKALDIEVIERELANLWKKTAGESRHGDALLRARAANLMVFLGDQSRLAETHEIIAELSSIHPCRALVMAGEKHSSDRDIELYVSAFCSTKRTPDDRLCCEEITLTAQGQFVSELPSAAVPLLIPDLPVFLWWRDALRADDSILRRFSLAADRVVIDSADFQDAPPDLMALTELCDEHNQTIAVSDLNWARLTAWRGLLATFYDVQDYRKELDQIIALEIHCVAQYSTGPASSSQALLMAGWLGSRLGWRISNGTSARLGPDTVSIDLAVDDGLIRFQLNAVERPAMKPGRLTQITLRTSSGASFDVTRSEDGLRLGTQAEIGGQIQAGRVSSLRNPNTSELLSRELEILGNDKIYEEAMAFAAKIAKTLASQ
jgi:glucose-6-phosphate dehydrogenase assembly protein OpcA